MLLVGRGKTPELKHSGPDFFVWNWLFPATPETAALRLGAAVFQDGMWLHRGRIDAQTSRPDEPETLHTGRRGWKTQELPSDDGHLPREKNI